MPIQSADRHLSRRGLLASGLLLATAGESGAQAGAPAREGELRVLTTTPRVLEGPFELLDEWVTPTPRLFLRSHFGVPELNTGAWRLRLEGNVRKPMTITYEELRRLPTRRVTAVLECAGNGRGLLVPTVKGVQWGIGAAGNAVWEGVPLSVILDRAGVRSDAAEIIAEGADDGEVSAEIRPQGRIRFARSVPLRKARADVLLAYRMNGADLTREHGFPVRLVVPGWYGVACVKWLTRLVVQAEPFRGFFQSVDYTVWNRRGSEASLDPITEIAVKAQIARPVPGSRVTPGAAVRVYGAAWSGESTVERVDVSADGGRTWTPARLLDPPDKHSWRRWEYPWRAPSRPGSLVLMARATDREGRTQPMERDPGLRNYMIHHVLPHEVRVG